MARKHYRLHIRVDNEGDWYNAESAEEALYIAEECFFQSDLLYDRFTLSMEYVEDCPNPDDCRIDWGEPCVKEDNRGATTDIQD
jgi:hypothetical protein